MESFEQMGDDFDTTGDSFEEVEVPEAVEPKLESVAAEPKPEPKPESKPEPKPEERQTTGVLGRSEKQQRVDAARAEQLKKLRERYDVEFANIQKKRPKPKAYNAASILSASDPEAKIKQILARDRAIYNEKQTRKGLKPLVTAKPNTNTRKRNAPSILSTTRSAANQIREKARADLKALKESAEKELREIGANVSVLHPIFMKEKPRTQTRTRSLPKSRRLTKSPNQITSNNN